VLVGHLKHAIRNLIKYLLNYLVAAKSSKLITAICDSSNASVGVRPGATPLMDFGRRVNHIVKVSNVDVVDRHVWSHVIILVRHRLKRLDIWHCQYHLAVKFGTDPPSYLTALIILFLTKRV
jgi:hypothetical protein